MPRDKLQDLIPRTDDEVKLRFAPAMWRDCNPEYILVPARYILPRGAEPATLGLTGEHSAVYAILLEANTLQ